MTQWVQNEDMLKVSDIKCEQIKLLDEDADRWTNSNTLFLTTAWHALTE